MAVAANTKPVVLPDSFTGEAGWDEWITHFENVADVNGWSAAQKLKWIKVCLTGRAQKAFQRLPEASRSDYKEAKKALKARFEPESKKTRYQAEFQTRRKKKFENWADFVRLLADKAFPELQDEARERLALNSYLSQLDQPQVAFSVKQKRPESLDDAVTATLEMESYVIPKTAPVSSMQEEESVTASVSTQDKLTSLVEKLERGHSYPARERLSMRSADQRRLPMTNPRGGRQAEGLPRSRPPMESRPSTFEGACWKCGRKGHMARNCQKPGN